MSSWKFTLTPTLKLSIAEEVKAHRENPNWKKDKSAVRKAMEKILESEGITEAKKVEKVKKVSWKWYLCFLMLIHCSGHLPILCK